jgi:mandelate racemase
VSARPALTIRDLRIWPVIAPLATPLHTASGSIEQVPLLLLDLETEEGVTGRAYLFAFSPFALRPLSTLVEELGAMLPGRALVPLEIERALRQQFTLLGGARNLAGLALSGLDMAAWDALAVAHGLPLARLLGGQPRPIQAYNSLGMIPASAARDAAEQTVARGFRALKIKVGWPSLEDDLAVVRAVRGALPEAVRLMVDFNQSLSAAEAIRRGRALQSEGVYWIEEPVRCDDLVSCARVAAALDVPIQLGENLGSPSETASAIAHRASDYLMLDVQQIGGVTGWIRAAALAQAAGIEVSSHIFLEASAHLLAATPACHWIEYLDLAAPVIQEPMRIVNGCVSAPERPGMGLGWNDEAVERYRAR